MDLANELNYIYFTEETVHPFVGGGKLSEEEAYEYHRILLERGNIITVVDGEAFCGYVEYWRLTFEQFGRVICGEPISAINEDVQTGQIAYVANTFIFPEYRQGAVARMLRERFFEANEPCTHFCGNARRKRSEPVKVFRKEQIARFNKLENPNVR